MTWSVAKSWCGTKTSSSSRIFEASEGLGALFAERGGELIISAPLSRERELDELLADLQNELQAHVTGFPLPTVP